MASTDKSYNSSNRMYPSLAAMNALPPNSTTNSLSQNLTSHEETTSARRRKSLNLLKPSRLGDPKALASMKDTLNKNMYPNINKFADDYALNDQHRIKEYITGQKIYPIQESPPGQKLHVQTDARHGYQQPVQMVSEGGRLVPRVIPSVKQIEKTKPKPLPNTNNSQNTSVESNSGSSSPSHSTVRRGLSGGVGWGREMTSNEPIIRQKATPPLATPFPPKKTQSAQEMDEQLFLRAQRDELRYFNEQQQKKYQQEQLLSSNNQQINQQLFEDQYHSNQSENNQSTSQRQNARDLYSSSTNSPGLPTSVSDRRKSEIGADVRRDFQRSAVGSQARSNAPESVSRTLDGKALASSQRAGNDGSSTVDARSPLVNQSGDSFVNSDELSGSRDTERKSRNVHLFEKNLREETNYSQAGLQELVQQRTLTNNKQSILQGSQFPSSQRLQPLSAKALPSQGLVSSSVSARKQSIPQQRAGVSQLSADTRQFASEKSGVNDARNVSPNNPSNSLSRSASGIQLALSSSSVKINPVNSDLKNDSVGYNIQHNSEENKKLFVTGQSNNSNLSVNGNILTNNLTENRNNSNNIRQFVPKFASQQNKQHRKMKFDPHGISSNKKNYMTQSDISNQNNSNAMKHSNINNDKGTRTFREKLLSTPLGIASRRKAFVSSRSVGVRGGTFAGDPGLENGSRRRGCCGDILRKLVAADSSSLVLFPLHLLMLLSLFLYLLIGALVIQQVS